MRLKAELTPVPKAGPEKALDWQSYKAVNFSLKVDEITPLDARLMTKFEICRLSRQLSKKCLETDPRRKLLNGFYPGLCSEVKDFYSGLKMSECLEDGDSDKRTRSLQLYMEENVSLLDVSFEIGLM